MTRPMRRIVLAWIFFIPIAIINAAIREAWYKPYVGTLAAHQISTATGIFAFIGFAFLMVRQVIRDASFRKRLGIGTLWVLLTVLFEFGFGHYVMGNSWEKLLADYDIATGHVWGLFLVAVFLTPLLIGITGNKAQATHN